MEVKKLISLGIIVLYLLGFPFSALAFKELSDDELDGITAGSALPWDEDTLRSFTFNKTTRSGKHITGHGSIGLLFPPNVAVLELSGSAQQNLRALININAVNSSVQVLFNLTINIDSKVGTVKQFNFTLRPLR